MIIIIIIIIIMAGIVGVLIEGETRLTRTGGIGGLSGSDVVYTQWPHTGRGLAAAVAAGGHTQSLLSIRNAPLLECCQKVYYVHLS